MIKRRSFLGSVLAGIAQAAGVSLTPTAVASEITTGSLCADAFDKASMHGVAYNVLASRQDDFGEAFFPTVVVNPTQVGFVSSVRLFDHSNVRLRKKQQ